MTYEYLQILKNLSEQQINQYVQTAKMLGMKDEVIQQGIKYIHSLKGEQKHE